MDQIVEMEVTDNTTTSAAAAPATTTGTPQPTATLIRLDPTVNQPTVILPQIPLVGTKVKIGRGMTNNFIILDTKISREHAEFVYLANKWYIKHSSTNGVFRNGNSLPRDELCVLEHNDVIYLVPDIIPAYEYRIEYANPVTQVEEPMNEAVEDHNYALGLPSSTSSVQLVLQDEIKLSIVNGRPGPQSSKTALAATRMEDRVGPSRAALSPLNNRDQYRDWRESVAKFHKQNASMMESIDTDIEKQNKIPRLDLLPTIDMDESSQDSCCEIIGEYERVGTVLKPKDNSGFSEKFSTLVVTKEAEPSKPIPIIPNDEQQQLLDEVEQLKTKLEIENEKTKELQNVEALKLEAEATASELRSLPGKQKEILLQYLKDAFSCPICTEILIEPFILHPCGHSFCGYCIYKSIFTTRKYECPTCKTEMGNLNKHVALENLIESTLSLVPEPVQLARLEIIQKRKAQTLL